MNSQKVKDPLQFFTDDSLFAIRRFAYSLEQNKAIGIYRGEDENLVKEGKKLSAPLNTYPVNSGLIVHD